MISIITARIHDVPDIVRIHDQAFGDFFLTSLGDGFLRLYYKCMVKSCDAVTLCALDDGALVGFATTAVASAGFNTRLVKANLPAFACEGIRLLLTKPKALVRLASNMSKTNTDVVDDGQYAELFSIGVSPACQGKGVGKKLLAETERRLLQSGIDKLSLTTDKDDNESTIAFYQHCGYGLMYEFTSYPNRRMLRLVKNLL